jgi:predicted ATPase/class 3 adenylate cyclase
MSGLPEGTVTFLFTDIEGSTRLWEEHPDAMQTALARHDAILTDAVRERGGTVVKTTGDGVHAVFPEALAAVSAALDGQRGLADETWGETGPIRVRMGLHAGTAELRDGDYYGSVLNRAARLMSVAHGGQVVISRLTEQLVRDSLGADVVLVDLGQHRLRDLAEPMHIFQATHVDLEQDFPPLRSLDVASGNLPAQLSSFVGRGRDLERLRDLVVSRRLLTLTGVGGVGKTRLALQAAIDLQPRFPGGAWLAELARTGDPDAVASVVVGALAATRAPSQSDIDVVCEQLGTTRSILVLDNCEHVLDAAAELAAAVLEQCPNVVVVATSREPLDLDGEQVVPVRPLDAETDAVSLFVERAQSVDPEFSLDADSLRATEEICARLDGVPLAIELAAARVDTIAPTELAARLDDRFRLLSSGRRRSVDRHQTLRATLEWSHQLLDADAQVLLRRLGVFSGGFTANAARTVCGDDTALVSLVRKSLVQFEREPKPGRYRLLETVRVFALEQLAAAGEADAIGRAHADWVATIVDHPIEDWNVEGAIDREQLDAEHDNWREAVSFAVSAADAALALRLAGLHTRAAADPETGRWTASVLALDGIEELPGAYWIHYTLAIATVSANDYDAGADHVAAFRAASTEPRDRAWIAPFEAVLAVSYGDPLSVLAEALSIPGLSPLERANLLFYDALIRNLPPATDADAARAAVHMATEAHQMAMPVTYAVLAMSLRESDPEGAMAALRRAEELAEETSDSFIIASASAWGSLATLALPTDAAAGHLLGRLDRMQPFFGNAEAALFSLCLCVLRRAGDPAADPLHAFLFATPTGARVARSIDRDLPDPDPMAVAPATFADTVALTRAALLDLVYAGSASGGVEAEGAS